MKGVVTQDNDVWKNQSGMVTDAVLIKSLSYCKFYSPYIECFQNGQTQGKLWHQEIYLYNEIKQQLTRYKYV